MNEKQAAEHAHEERVAELAEAFLEQLRQGKRFSVAEYAAQFPQEEADLLELLPAMETMEHLGQSATRPVRDAVASYPDVLGDFRLLERIGSGGMGTVFRAMQMSLNREVAVKILAPSWNADANHCEAFENESRVIAGLRHTNIVEVFGAGHEGDFRYYVMSLVEGSGVTRERIREAFPGVPYGRALARVGLQAAKALAYAHGQGVLHRDIKPGNLLLDKTGRLHVGDFGLATVLNSGENAPLVTQSHDGTLRYMPPERLARGENSFAGDQYSLGLSLYELLTGRPAFRETAPGKLIRRICEEPIAPLRHDGELGAIINKSISFEPTERYATMDDMAADLQRYLNGEPVKARPAHMLRRYALWLRRRPAVAVWSHAAVLAALLLLLSISVGYMEVREALQKENEQRLLAQENEQIADSALKRIFAGMLRDSSGELMQPTRADARLLQDLMPYYEAISTRTDTGSSAMQAACYTLATIALKTDDADTAELYFTRAAELAQPASAEEFRALNGRADALFAKRNREAAQEAVQCLHQMVEQVPEGGSFEKRLEVLKALTKLSMRYRGREGHDKRMETLRRAVGMVQQLLAENPENEQARLAQVLLMENVPPREREALHLPSESTVQVLENLLQQQPQSRAYQLAYVRHMVRPSPRRWRQTRNVENLERATEYARRLLSDSPADSERLMLYLSASDAYSLALAQAGKQEESCRLNEQTLGVLSLLSSGSQFSPEMRERLVMLVSMHPTAPEARSQQEAEISLLLKDYDEKRLQQVRERLQMMRRHVHARRHRFRENRKQDK